VTKIERICEIGEYVDSFGKDDAMFHFGITAETVKRYMHWYRQHKRKMPKTQNLQRTIEKLVERFSPGELRAIAEGKNIDKTRNTKKISFDGDVVTVAFVTDTHWGAKHSPVEWWDSALEEFDKAGVEIVLHGGDLIEGMSNRPDQIYGLTHVGFSAQMDLAQEQLEKCRLPIYIIDGNHDRWGIKSGGVMAVKDVAKRMDHVEFIGHDEGDIDINGTVWRMWHGEDGSSYATSYRMQKVIESFTGGEKPNVLLAGHVHKQGYFFERNIHAVSGGAMCRQSAWMRSKRLANHSGFHIIKACIADGEIKWFEPRWYPFY
jgi:predicted phosphodiesterase